MRLQAEGQQGPPTCTRDRGQSPSHPRAQPHSLLDLRLLAPEWGEDKCYCLSPEMAVSVRMELTQSQECVLGGGGEAGAAVGAEGRKRRQTHSSGKYT